MILAFLTGGLAGAPCPAGADDNSTGGRGPITPDNEQWTDDTVLTFSQYAENQPALAVDENGDSMVSWNRTGQLIMKKVDLFGAQLLADKTVASGFVPLQHTGQPTERMGVDGQDNLSIAWCARDSLYCPQYQKFASNGSALCIPANLTPMSTDPHAVSLCAGSNGRAYIAYENDNSQRIEMAYIDTSFNLHTGYIAGQGGRGVTIGIDRQDKPHVFWRDTTGGDMDLRMAIFSSEGNKLQDTTMITAPTGISGPDVPMPALAFGTDGAIHILQASSLTGSRTLFYTKLAPNGTKLTPDIRLTSVAADFGDICLDRGNNVIVAWGDSSDGEIYYATILKNNESDTISPVKVTDSFGRSMSPSMAMDTVGRLHLVWVDGRDGTDRIYYKLRYSSGVVLSMSTTEMVKMASVRPNQTVFANVTLCNPGMVDDTAYMGISADFHEHPGGTGKDYAGDGWKVWIDDEYKTFNISVCETRKITLSVRGPVRGMSNDYITVTVNATSKTRPLSNQTVDFRVYLIVYREIMLFVSDHVHSTSIIPPGVTTVYSIGVANRGDVEETVDLSANGPPNWKWVLNVSELCLRPGMETYVPLNVTPPVNAIGEEVGVVTVYGRSRSVPSIKDQASTFTIISTILSLDISAEPTEAFVDPGGTAGFLLTVWNHGNMVRKEDFAIGTGPVPQDWVVSFDKTAVELEGENCAQVVLNVTAPENASAGTKLSLTVNCYDAEWTVSARCTVTVIVNPVHGIRVSIAPRVAHLAPGEAADIWLNITNTGNMDEPVSLGGFQIPPGWSGWFVGSGMKGLEDRDNLTIRAHSIAEFHALLASPFDALCGDFYFPGVVEDGAKNSHPVELSVHVEQVHSLELNCSSPKQAGYPGKTVQFPLTVINAGNGPDKVRVESSDMPAGWHPPYFLLDNETAIDWFDLNASQRLVLIAWVRVPDTTPRDVVNFNVTAISSSGLSTSVFLSVLIGKPDLVIAHVRFSPPVLHAGERVTVEVTVDNRGNAAAENVCAAIYHGTDVQRPQSPAAIEAGAVWVFSFAWTPAEGTNLLRFMVDPDDSVYESNETNNSETVLRSTVDDAVTVQPANPWLAAAAAVLGVVTLTYLGIKRRRRP